jgi:hypothetical protein
VLADDILSRSAAETVALYRSKQVSPVEVVTATLDRIDRLDPLYNASSWSIAKAQFAMLERRKNGGGARNGQGSRCCEGHGTLGSELVVRATGGPSSSRKWAVSHCLPAVESRTDLSMDYRTPTSSSSLGKRRMLTVQWTT